MKEKLTALNNKVIVKPLEQEEKSTNGIYLPPSAQLKNIEGVVVSVGPGWLLQDGSYAKPEVYVGDQVVYDSKAADPVEIDGEKFLFLPLDALLAKKG